MKTLKQLLFASAFVFCVSMSASAQDRDGKRTPPKDRPPVVVVEPKKDRPKDDKPKDDRSKDNRGKKPPQAFVFNAEREVEINLA